MIVVPVVALAGIAKGFIPALTILGITNWISGPKNMAEYEKEFITAHEHEQYEIIPSGFDEKMKKTGLFLQLCEPYISLEDLAKYPLQIELNHIDFKKTVHPAFAAEVLRCNNKYAIMKTPKTDCVYLLRKGTRNPNFKGDAFFFKDKFCYYPKRGLAEKRIGDQLIAAVQESPVLDKNPEQVLDENSPRMPLGQRDDLSSIIGPKLDRNPASSLEFREEESKNSGVFVPSANVSANASQTKSEVSDVAMSPPHIHLETGSHQGKLIEKLDPLIPRPDASKNGTVATSYQKPFADEPELDSLHKPNTANKVESESSQSRSEISDVAMSSSHVPNDQLETVENHRGILIEKLDPLVTTHKVPEDETVAASYQKLLTKSSNDEPELHSLQSKPIMVTHEGESESSQTKLRISDVAMSSSQAPDNQLEKESHQDKPMEKLEPKGTTYVSKDETVAASYRKPLANSFNNEGGLDSLQNKPITAKDEESESSPIKSEISNVTMSASHTPDNQLETKSRRGKLIEKPDPLVTTYDASKNETAQKPLANSFGDKLELDSLLNEPNKFAASTLVSHLSNDKSVIEEATPSPEVTNNGRSSLPDLPDVARSSDNHVDFGLNESEQSGPLVSESREQEFPVYRSAQRSKELTPPTHRFSDEKKGNSRQINKFEPSAFGPYFSNGKYKSMVHANFQAFQPFNNLHPSARMPMRVAAVAA